MSRITDIILRARDTLADNGQRWSDARLLRLVDEAQKNICRRAKVLRYSVNIVVHPSQSTYTLPSNSQIITRVLYNNEPIEIVTHDQMDFNKGPEWETDTGEPEYAITNKLERGLLKLSPIPDFVENVPFSFTKANKLSVYYIQKPETITADTDELEIESIYDSLIRYYVTGHALRDDMDAQNRLVGNEELGIYEAELGELALEVERDFSEDSTFFETTYRSGG